MQEGQTTPTRLERRSDAEAMAILLGGGERWGWVADEPSQQYRPYSVPRPAPNLPAPPAITGPPPPTPRRTPSRLFGIRASRYLLASLAVIVIGIPIDVAVEGRGSTPGTVVMSILIYVLWIMALVAVIRHRLRPGAERRRSRSQQRNFEQEYEDAKAAWERSVQDWDAARQQHEAAEAARIAQLPLYQPVHLTSKPRRVDVFGEMACWHDMLATVGGSLIGSGRRMVLLDFSATGAASRLLRLCTEAGVPFRSISLPDDASGAELLVELTPDQLTDVLVESLYGGAGAAAADQRAMADRLLGEVVNALHPHITMARLWRGTRVAMGHEPDAPTSTELDDSEWRRLQTTHTPQYRAMLAERLGRLEHLLHILRGAGEPGPSVQDGETAAESLLECYAVSRTASNIEKELLRDVIVECILRRQRQPGADVLVVAGAETLDATQLRRVNEHATDRNLRLIMLFAEFEPDTLDFAGSGGAAAFFRLANAEQARRAADWIGQEHRFVIGALTQQRSRLQVHAEEHRSSSSESRKRAVEGGAGVSASLAKPIGFFLKAGADETTVTARSRSEATLSVDALAESYGYAQQRVYEHVVETMTLRNLPPNTMLLVELDPAAGRRIVAVDCTPELALDPRVSS